MRRPVIVPLLLCALLATQTGAEDPASRTSDPSRPSGGSRSLRLAATASVRDSGLLDALLPDFRERTGIDVQVVAVDGDEVLRMAREGDADALLTDAEADERLLVAEGAAASRTPFMESHFVIAGPPDDPAGIASAGGPVQALQRIAQTRAPFVSRGDHSATHQREQQLFALAGLDPEAKWEGFSTTGSGMAPSLRVAGERGAYVLSDLGSFLALRDRAGLVRWSDDSPSLRNVYAVLRISAERFAGQVHAAEARAFETFLTAPDTQRRIADFGSERFGTPPFRPLLPTASPALEPPSRDSTRFRMPDRG